MQALPGLAKPPVGLGKDVHRSIPEFSSLYKVTISAAEHLGRWWGVQAWLNLGQGTGSHTQH